MFAWGLVYVGLGLVCVWRSLVSCGLGLVYCLRGLVYFGLGLVYLCRGLVYCGLGLVYFCQRSCLRWFLSTFGLGRNYLLLGLVYFGPTRIYVFRSLVDVGLGRASFLQRQCLLPPASCLLLQRPRLRWARPCELVPNGLSTLSLVLLTVVIYLVYCGLCMITFPAVLSTFPEPC